MKKIIITLADGFEEIEAIASIDVLRRAGIEVTIVTLGDLEVKGAHGLAVLADRSIDDIKPEDFDGILLPGGMPGATNLRDNDKVIATVKSLNESGKLISAICAAPIVLEKAGIIKDKSVTSYPGFEDQLLSANHTGERVTLDGNIITAKGPGAAIEFALEVVRYLIDDKRVEELKEGMIVL